MKFLSANILLLSCILFTYKTYSHTTNGKIEQSNMVSFTENKGQVYDQNNQPRPDVLYSGFDGKMAFHIKNSGISYQLTHASELKHVFSTKSFYNENKFVHSEISIYRIDINWIGSNFKFESTTDEVLPGTTNYYLNVCPKGVQNVKSYKGVTLKNIYNNIDLHYFESNGGLKYDFIVAPHADYKKIRLQVNGANIFLQDDGSVLLRTPFGDIQENAPVVFQNNKQLPAKWVISGNELLFDIANYDSSLPLIIDPITRVWGTYYGGSLQDNINFVKTNATGDLYACGTTQSSNAIATAGAHQVTLAGNTEGYIAKFNSAGVRQWGTYYGGTGFDYAFSCDVDASGNVFVSGQTNSSGGTAIATLGSHQPAFGGNVDSYLVKFNSSGVRQWGTYYGGTALDNAGYCAVDASGDIYLCGNTSTSTGTIIATAGSHQQTNSGNGDSFLAKFNTSGVRQWATYYGGSSFDGASGCISDASGNIFLTGQTESTNGTFIATLGSHQPSSGGGPIDGYLVMFNSSGVRQWGTYYGGNNDEVSTSVCTDGLGGIFIAGYSASTNGTSIATALSHQPVHGGGIDDGFIAKFNLSGVRQWATYYGGNSDDYIFGCTSDPSGNIYVSGSADNYGIGVISTPGTHQTLFGGGANDAFISKFDSNGNRIWGSYYGGASNDNGYSITVDNSNNVHLGGSSASNTGTTIASLGSHQIGYGGGLTDGFVAKFIQCAPANTPTNTTIPANQNICINNTTTLSVIGTGTLNWYSTISSTLSLGTGSNYTTPSMSVTGTYSFYAAATNTCAEGNRVLITVSVNPSPTISVSNGTICQGQTFTITPAGASTYTISGGSTVVSPTTNTSYSITGTSSVGCLSSNTVISNVIVNPSPTINVTSNGSLICVGQTATLTASGGNTYTWSTTSNNSSIVISPTITTSYTVNASGLNGCTGTAIITQSVDACTAISELDYESVEIMAFPNPFTSKLTIMSSEKMNDVQIYNSIGKLIYRNTYNENSSSNKLEIDFANQNSGIYFVKVDNKVINVVKQ